MRDAGTGVKRLPDICKVGGFVVFWTSGEGLWAGETLRGAGENCPANETRGERGDDDTEGIVAGKGDKLGTLL